MTEQEKENDLSDSSNFDEHLNLWFRSSTKSTKIGVQRIMKKQLYHQT
jgi:hypothetical protein